MKQYKFLSTALFLAAMVVVTLRSTTNTVLSSICVLWTVQVKSLCRKKQKW